MNVLSLFDGKYEIDAGGNVYSNVGSRKRLKGKITRDGYHMVVFNADGCKLYKNVHRLIAESFIPNPDNKPEVNHIDGNKTNNNVLNLEWCTPSENQKHARNFGLRRCKITMEIAEEIRKLYSEGGWSHRTLGEKFGIKKTNIGYIINNQRWAK